MSSDPRRQMLQRRRWWTCCILTYRSSRAWKTCVPPEREREGERTLWEVEKGFAFKHAPCDQGMPNMPYVLDSDVVGLACYEACMVWLHSPCAGVALWYVAG